MTGARVVAATVVALGLCAALGLHDTHTLAIAQQQAGTTQLPDTFGFGRPATPAEIARLDIDVAPDGAGRDRWCADLDTVLSRLSRCRRHRRDRRVGRGA